MKKSLKFRDHLVKLVLEEKKDVTWRLFDDKDLSEGDEVDLINWNTKEKFGEAILTDTRNSPAMKRCIRHTGLITVIELGRIQWSR